MTLDSVALYVKVEDLMVDAEAPEQILLTTTVYDVPIFGRVLINATKASFIDEDYESIGMVKAAKIIRSKGQRGFWIMVNGTLIAHGRYYGPVPGSAHGQSMSIHDEVKLLPWEWELLADDISFIQVVDSKLVEVPDSGDSTA